MANNTKRREQGSSQEEGKRQVRTWQKHPKFEIISRWNKAKTLCKIELAYHWDTDTTHAFSHTNIYLCFLQCNFSSLERLGSRNGAAVVSPRWCHKLAALIALRHAYSIIQSMHPIHTEVTQHKVTLTLKFNIQANQYDCWLRSIY